MPAQRREALRLGLEDLEYSGRRHSRSQLFQLADRKQREQYLGLPVAVEKVGGRQSPEQTPCCPEKRKAAFAQIRRKDRDLERQGEDTFGFVSC